MGVVHVLGGSAMPRTCRDHRRASPALAAPHREIMLIAWEAMLPVSAIKLIRTDTTLDLSQKAEKGIQILGRDDVRPIPCTLYAYRRWQVFGTTLPPPS